MLEGYAVVVVVAVLIFLVVLVFLLNYQLTYARRRWRESRDELEEATLCHKEDVLAWSMKFSRLQAEMQDLSNDWDEKVKREKQLEEELEALRNAQTEVEFNHWGLVDEEWTTLKCDGARWYFCRGGSTRTVSCAFKMPLPTRKLTIHRPHTHPAERE